MQIEPEHRVVRNVGATKVLDGGVVDGSAFRVRPIDTDGLTVNLLDYFAGLSVDGQVQEIRKAFTAKGRKIGSSSKFAELNVGDTTQHVLSHQGRSLSFVHSPEPNDDSHTGIKGYAPEDDIIADLIAQTVKNLHPAFAS